MNKATKHSLEFSRRKKKWKQWAFWKGNDDLVCVSVGEEMKQKCLSAKWTLVMEDITIAAMVTDGG